MTDKNDTASPELVVTTWTWDGVEMVGSMEGSFIKVEPAETRKHHSDIDFVQAGASQRVIRLFVEPYEDGRILRVDFLVVRVDGVADDGVRLFSKDGRGRSTQNIDEADAETDGFVRWDGCTQFQMDCHIDALTDLESALAAVAQARREAAKLLSHWDCSEEYP